MDQITFSCDDRKARDNLRKHGVSFQEAMTAFGDPSARVKHDPDHSQEEERFLLLGLSAALRMLVVAHTYRREEKEIRIISARRATKSECSQYGGFL